MIIDDLLKFHNHTSAAVNKSNQILTIIKKSFMHLDMVTVYLLYKLIIWLIRFKIDGSTIRTHLTFAMKGHNHKKYIILYEF